MKFFRNIIRYCMICLLASVTATIPGKAFSQNSDKAIAADSGSKDSVVLVWLEDLYKEEVTVANDSVKIGKETTRLLSDEVYRSVMYPKAYTWQAAVYFIQRQDIKRACWFLLNLYLINDQNKDLVIKSLLTYDKLLKMDKILTNSFYTYVLSDTEIGSFEDGQYKVTAPHIMEKKLNALKEILFYLDKYRAKGQVPAR